MFLHREVGQTLEDQLLLRVQSMIAEYERAKILEHLQQYHHQFTCSDSQLRHGGSTLEPEKMDVFRLQGRDSVWELFSQRWASHNQTVLAGKLRERLHIESRRQIERAHPFKKAS